jgi:hypothetical protein
VEKGSSKLSLEKGVEKEIGKGAPASSFPSISSGSGSARMATGAALDGATGSKSTAGSKPSITAGSKPTTPSAGEERDLNYTRPRLNSQSTATRGEERDLKVDLKRNTRPTIK